MHVMLPPLQSHGNLGFQYSFPEGNMNTKPPRLDTFTLKNLYPTDPGRWKPLPFLCPGSLSLPADPCLCGSGSGVIQLQ